MGDYARIHKCLDLGEYTRHRLVRIALIDCPLDQSIHLAAECREDSGGLFYLLCFNLVSMVHEGFHFIPLFVGALLFLRSEERRVGKECRE